MPKHIKILFYSLLFVFILTILTIFTELIELSSYLFPILFLLCFLLGLILLVLSIKLERNKLKTLLIITISSLIGIPLLSVLHNLFYALNTVVSVTFLNSIISVLEGIFFIIAVVVCPVVFVVTEVWIIIYSIKNRV